MTRARSGYWALAERDRRELASWHLAADLCEVLPITAFFELHECDGTYDTLHLSVGAGVGTPSDQYVKINRVSGGSVHASEGGASTNPTPEDLCAPIPIGLDRPLYRAKQLAATFPEQLGHHEAGAAEALALPFMADLLGYAMARDSRRPWAWRSGVSDIDGWHLEWRPELFDAVPAGVDVLDSEPDPAEQRYWFLTHGDQPVLAVDAHESVVLIGRRRHPGFGAVTLRLAQAAVRKSAPKPRSTLPMVIDGCEYATLPAARMAYRSVAENLASKLAGGPVLPFSPGQRITTYAHWFNAGDDQLIVVMGPHESPASAITLLAYGLAWQSRRVLHLVLPPGFADAVVRVIPWLRTAIHVHLAVSTGLETLTPPRRQDVLEATRALPPRATSPHNLGANQIWIDGLLQAIKRLGLDFQPRPSYCAWKFRGRQVLKVSRAKGATLRLIAGTDFTKPTAAKPAAYKIPALSSQMSDEQVATAIDRIKASIADRLAGADAGDLEHQFQAELDLHGLPGVLAAHRHREYPAWRSAGRDGFIDFLAVTPAGDLDVVETKVGADAGVALQALEYFIWATAWADEVRGRQGWPGSTWNVHHQITLLLAPDGKGRSYDKYLFGVLEAFSIDVPWRVLIAGPIGQLATSVSLPPKVSALTLTELVTGINGEPPCSPMRYPNDMVYTDQDLFALTGAEDEDTLAWQLFSEIDGAVHLEEGLGLTVFMGQESEGMSYPFTLTTLKDLARVMETAEDQRLTPE
jgi:hypothetical protein